MNKPDPAFLRAPPLTVAAQKGGVHKTPLVLTLEVYEVLLRERQLPAHKFSMRDLIEEAVGTHFNLGPPAGHWLAQYRFYRSQAQCDQVNAARERIQRKDNEIRIWAQCSLHPDLEGSYFVREDVGSDAV